MSLQSLQEELASIEQMAKENEVAGHVASMLEALGQQPRAGLADTPLRVSRFYLTFLNPGPFPKLTVFEEENAEDMVHEHKLDFAALCVPSKQIIITRQGNKQASAIGVGDRLYTIKDGRVKTTEVVSVKSRKTRELVRVVTTKGSFLVTPEHPLGTLTSWVEARNAKGKFIEWTNPRQLYRQDFEVTPGYEFGYALGAIFSDGTVYRSRYVSLVVNDKAFAERFVKALKTAFGVTVNLERASRPSGFTGRQTLGWRVRVCNSYLCDLLRQYAGGDCNHLRQKFPDVVTYDKRCLKGFVDGYCDGDGSHWAARPSGEIIVSANKEFLLQLSTALGRDNPTCHKATNAFAMYIPDCWERGNFRNYHGFTQNKDCTFALYESSLVKVLNVVPVVANGLKPFTVYSWKCEPYPSFVISGHLTHNCEHHMLPFFGTASIAYIPDGKRVVGLSKLGRVLRYYAAALTTQERLSHQVCEAIRSIPELNPKGVGVAIRACHTCMSIRGVKAHSAVTDTRALWGVIKTDPQARTEFLNAIHF